MGGRGGGGEGGQGSYITLAEEDSGIRGNP